MKKLVLLALVTLVMTGCKREGEISTCKDGWTIVTIDSCEYIECSPYGKMLMHKNNCRFCEERRRAEIEKLLEKINK